jgi:photosystem II stability/assembly factor-like uncharacterized protein
MAGAGTAAAALLAIALTAGTLTATHDQKESPARVAVDPLLYQALRYRELGPFRGGRSTAVAGVPTAPFTFYMGNSGGLWKTTNAGQSWTNVSDGQFETSSVGAIAVADADPNVVYVGTGQACLRGNITTGLGVYRSDDAGRRWRHIGLRDVGQIARVRVHPTNPDLVYVASVGHAFGPNEERGVFRSSDGGRNWSKVLYVSTRTGVTDLAMDPNNPRILYAAAWTGERKPWTIVSGSEESALYKSVDGGDTWRKLAGGLPAGLVGKIGVAVSPANSQRIWAIVEADPGGLFRSDDAGETWLPLTTNQRRRLLQRSWYFMHVFADPRDENGVYVLNVDNFASSDGGRTFDEITTIPHGDGHDLWINPRDNGLMIMGHDGGASVSLDHGRTWSTVDNQPTAEIYYVAVDEQFPYHVYGAQQDNSTMRLPSRFASALTPYQHWRSVGGCEDGQIAVDPRDPNIVYAGCYGGEITRVNLRTGEERDVLAYPQMEVGLAPKDLRYRFNWNAPIRLSPHDPRVLYHASQVLHRSTDEGQSWTVISPDLSRNDKSKQDYAGEPITKENTGVEVYANILTFEESPTVAGLLWAGTDDGLVHVSRDAGKTWKNVTPKALPEWATVQMVAPSRHAPGRLFVAAHRYRFEDYKPYIFRTNDYGETWDLLTDGRNGIAASNPARVVREDPDRPGLLYAGTEYGMYVSFDDGRRWQTLQANLPLVPITDIAVHRKDLIVSTQGRGVWILDDLTPLHQIDRTTAQAPHHLFTPRDTYRLADQGRRRQANRGENPPNGATIFYSFAEEPRGEVTIEILDSQGRLVQIYSSERDPVPSLPSNPILNFRASDGDARVPKHRGMNRFVWDLRYPVVRVVDDAIVWGYHGGPSAVPGQYEVRLTADGRSQTRSFAILKDPRVTTTAADFDAQLALLLRARDGLSEVYDGVRAVRAIRDQAREVVARLAATGADVRDVRQQADALAAAATALEGELMQPRNQADQDTENFPSKLDNQLAYVYWKLAEPDAAPTAGQAERIADLLREKDVLLGRVRELVDREVAAFNDLARRRGAAPITVAAPRPRPGE